MKLIAILVAVLGLAGISSPNVFAQSYPSKPVRLICPYPPGGATDIISRAIANELSKTLGQPVIVDNRPGAGGRVGAEVGARSAPDGYTISLSGISSALGPLLYSKMNYDPIRDFAPIIALASFSNVLVVNPSVKAESVKELIALAKSAPGALTFASSGTGATTHLSGELFKYLTGIDMLHVPYKGSAPAVADLIGGQVQMMFDNIPSSLPHIRAGRLRALAVTGAKREAELPDVPTIAEAGVAAYESGGWFGLAAPTGTPKEIVAKLNEAAVKGIESPEFVKRMTGLGYSILGGTPEQMSERIDADTRYWSPVVKALRTGGAVFD